MIFFIFKLIISSWIIEKNVSSKIWGCFKAGFNYLIIKYMKKNENSEVFVLMFFLF
jgi:hypothetical protein